jgi:hypothetical protein
MKLAERGSRLSNGLWVRKVQNLSEVAARLLRTSTARHRPAPRAAVKKRLITIPAQDLPESDRFSPLLIERQHFIDTLKLIAYRAETSMA